MRGLRRDEIGSFTGRSFDWDTNRPVLIVDAGYAALGVLDQASAVEALSAVTKTNVQMPSHPR